MKKHRERTDDFGQLDDWERAKARYEREWPDILKGPTPPVASEDEDDACTPRTLRNLFLESKRNQIAAGDLTQLSYRENFRSCGRLQETGEHLASTCSAI
ncbi:MAG: hypothetical protein AB7U20_05040 [Planctomycetaceae bacterium]